MKISQIAVDKLEIRSVEKMFRILFCIRKIDHPSAELKKVI